LSVLKLRDFGRVCKCEVEKRERSFAGSETERVVEKIDQRRRGVKLKNAS